MIAFGFGRPEQILAELRLDLDQFRAELKESKGVAKRDGAQVGKNIGEGLKKAAAAAIVSKVSIESLKKAYELTRNAIERIGERRGATDPGVRAFDRLRGSATRLFDGFVEGVFASGAVQTALGAISTKAEAVAESAQQIGKRFDEFVKKHAPTIASALVLAVEYFERVKINYVALEGAFIAVSATVAAVASKVVGFIASILEGADALVRAIGPGEIAPLREAAESVREASSILGEAAALTAEDAVEKFDDMVDGFEGLPSRLEEIRAKILGLLEKPEEGGGRTGGLIFEDVDDEKAVITAVDDIANKIGDSFAAGFDRIKGLFSELGANAKRLGTDTAATFNGISAAFGGLAAAASAAERAFGTSSRAAEVFKRAQLGVAAIVSTVRGLMSFAAASSENAQGNQGAAGLHVAAGAGFFAAAALAGAQAAGAIGGGAVSAGGAGSAGSTQTIDAGDTVSQRQTNITFVIEGNLIDNRDFVRSQLIPAINDLVAQEDVTVTATQARRANQVGAI